jgi:hypothetical protein
MEERESIINWFSGFVFIFLICFVLYTVNRLYIGFSVSLLEIWGASVILINLVTGLIMYIKQKD